MTDHTAKAIEQAERAIALTDKAIAQGNRAIANTDACIEAIKQLAGEVLTLLDMQQHYYETKSHTALLDCKRLEARMRKRVTAILAPAQQEQLPLE
jgi:hypothetical protein